MKAESCHDHIYTFWLIQSVVIRYDFNRVRRPAAADISRLATTPTITRRPVS